MMPSEMTVTPNAAAVDKSEERKESVGLPKAYTVEQVSVILQCHPKTVRKLCAEGRLRSVPLGPRHRRITREALNEFLRIQK